MDNVNNLKMLSEEERNSSELSLDEKKNINHLRIKIALNEEYRARDLQLNNELSSDIDVDTDYEMIEVPKSNKLPAKPKSHKDRVPFLINFYGGPDSTKEVLMYELAALLRTYHYRVAIVPDTKAAYDRNGGLSKLNPLVRMSLPGRQLNNYLEFLDAGYDYILVNEPVLSMAFEDKRLVQHCLDVDKELQDQFNVLNIKVNRDRTEFYDTHCGEPRIDKATEIGHSITAFLYDNEISHLETEGKDHKKRAWGIWDHHLREHTPGIGNDKYHNKYRAVKSNGLRRRSPERTAIYGTEESEKYFI